jgi:hypothetical protein
LRRAIVPKSTTATARGKAANPHRDYLSLFCEPVCWAEHVRGKLHYFGTSDNPQAALDGWKWQNAGCTC